jgi:hypothetical protein
MELLDDVGHMDVVSVCLEAMLCRCKIGTMFEPNIP